MLGCPPFEETEELTLKENELEEVKLEGMAKGFQYNVPRSRQVSKTRTMAIHESVRFNMNLEVEYGEESARRYV